MDRVDRELAGSVREWSGKSATNVSTGTPRNLCHLMKHYSLNSLFYEFPILDSNTRLVMSLPLNFLVSYSIKN